MKNALKTIIRFALFGLAVYALSLTACDNGTGGGGNKGGNKGGNTTASFSVTYNGNGNTGGTVPVDANSPYQKDAEVTVLGNTGNLVKTNNTFSGWNTKADGTGTSYTQGSEFNISANTTLYAKWLPDNNGGGNNGSNVLSGNITITPNTNVTTGTLLTASYSGSENVIFQWKRGSENVETGTRFRPLRSGSLTVTVSASGYESKSANVNVTGETANMFWWGNYIPAEGTHQNPPNLSAAIFSLDELVVNVNNARKRCRLALGAPVTEENVIVNQDGSFGDRFNNLGVKQTTTTKTALHADPPRWEEKKSAESAVKVNKTINYEPYSGFVYFISPVSFGDIIIRDAANVNITINIFTKHTLTIDGVNYNIYRFTSPITTPYTPGLFMTFTFDFN